MAGVLASATSCQPQPARLASNNRSYRSRCTPFMSALFFASKERQDDPRRIGRDLSVRAVLTDRGQPTRRPTACPDGPHQRRRWFRNLGRVPSPGHRKRPDLCWRTTTAWRFAGGSYLQGKRCPRRRRRCRPGTDSTRLHSTAQQKEAQNIAQLIRGHYTRCHQEIGW